MAVDAKLRHDFLSKGWVISNRIGGGGGGDVYLAYPKTFIDSIIQAAAAVALMQAAGGDRRFRAFRSPTAWASWLLRATAYRE